MKIVSHSREANKSKLLQNLNLFHSNLSIRNPHARISSLYFARCKGVHSFKSDTYWSVGVSCSVERFKQQINGRFNEYITITHMQIQTKTNLHLHTYILRNKQTSLEKDNFLPRLRNNKQIRTHSESYTLIVEWRIHIINRYLYLNKTH